MPKLSATPRVATELVRTAGDAIAQTAREAAIHAPRRRRDRHLPPAVLLTALCILASAPGSSQGHPNHSIGLTPDGSYDSGGIDNISLFSGAATLSIPIGPRYPVSSTLSYGLTAVYNSNVWEYKSVAYQGQTYTEAYPSRQQNLGLGWMITLGELWHPGYVYNQTDDWIYVDSSGAAHKFYNELMQGTSDGSASHHYTRDGSFIRLRQIDNWNATIETPDGLIRKFEKPGGRFRLTRIEDRFGNWVRVDYNANETLWTITDQHSRTHYVVLEERPSTGLTISAIDFQGRGGQRLLWTFSHWVQNRNRSCKHTHPAVPARISVPLLVSINRPDGSSFKMLETGGQPAYNDLCPGGMLDFPGTLSRVVLPTQGSIEYEYQRYDFPLGPLDVYTAGTGVHKRTLRDRDGSLLGQRVYKSFRDIQNWEMVTSVLEPTGECTRHWFYANPSPSQPSQTGWEYGLPFTTRFTSGGRYLSSQVLPSHNGNACTGTVLRSSYVTFAHDEPLPSLGNPADPSRWYNTNRRLAGSRTVFHDDGNGWVDTALSNYDGVGHYRTATTTGNIGPAAPHSRTVTTNFNPGRPAVAPWPTGNPWILGTFNNLRVDEPGATGETTARVEYKFDTATGALECQRVLTSGATRADTDLVTEYVRNGAGYVTQVRTRGGDAAGLSTGVLCAGSGGHGANFGYAAGALKTVRPLGSTGGGLSYFTHDATIDSSTGWVTATRDPSGLQTTYTHDALGRVTAVTPAEGARSTTAYVNATGTNPARVHTTVTGAGVTLSESEVILDGLGRSVEQRRRVPDNGWVSTYTTYDAGGRVTSQSLANNPARSVRYLNYDAFSRPGIIRPPEGAAHDVLLSYTGVRLTQRQVKMGVLGGEAYQTWTNTYDSFGRLRIVTEPGAEVGQETGQTLRAGYGYDVGGRLTVAETVDGATGVRQTRRFQYDNRGFLRQEYHPEITAAGVFYRGYDALGNFSRVFVSGARDLRYVYDVFGRLIEVRDGRNDTRLVQRYEYDSAPGRGEGKLALAVRHNYVTMPGTGNQLNVRVFERYSYQGTAGALSSRTMEVTRGNLEFREEYGYDTAGQLTSLTYPECQHTGCGTSLPARTVNHSYQLGHLRWVGGFGGPITYHPDGSWATIPHGNGVTDVRGLNAANPSRTGRLRTTGASGGNYDTEAFGYDGAGNITQMGQRRYIYDAVGRLTDSMHDSAHYDWRYTYDAFGNLKSHNDIQIDGSGQQRTFQINTSTNRLSSGSYDATGNLLTWGGGSYGYDELGNLRQVGSSTVYVYSPSGERVATYHSVGAGFPIEETYTLRGAGGQPLREVARSTSMPAGELNWIRDYVWRGGQLMAATVPTQSGGEVKWHYTLDHLGSPAIVTSWQSDVLARYDQAPFGQDTSSSNPPKHAAFPLRFTGHERDFHNAGTLDDLDYMHARSYTPHIGRFLQVDPVLGRPGSPQSWNRYAYVGNNPVNFTDPTGLCETDGCIDVIEKDPGPPRRSICELIPWACYRPPTPPPLPPLLPPPGPGLPPGPTPPPTEPPPVVCSAGGQCIVPPEPPLCIGEWCPGEPEPTEVTPPTSTPPRVQPPPEGWRQSCWYAGVKTASSGLTFIGSTVATGFACGPALAGSSGASTPLCLWSAGGTVGSFWWMVDNAIDLGDRCR